MAEHTDTLTIHRQQLLSARRWVIKIGSALLTDVDQGLNTAFVQRLVAQVVALRQAGCEVLVVSSGSIAEGMQRLGWRERPREVHQLQSAAAVGQTGLSHCYQSEFSQHDTLSAQILLTHADLSNRERYLNARSTLRHLLSLGVVPIVNENDTVATDEVRGDNDTLAALVANLVEADVLVLMTDQDGLCDKDPREHADAKLIHEGIAGDPALTPLAGGGGALGTGGMVTKLLAAAKAARSATTTLIASGHEPDILKRLLRGERLGTLLSPEQGRIGARKQWLAGLQQSAGRLMLDAGAVKVLRDQGRSLLPIGVTQVEGQFTRGSVVACIAPDGSAVAMGLVNYSADEVRQILGKPSQEIESILGYVDREELIHRDNLALVSR